MMRELRGSGERCAHPFRCQGGCLEDDATGQRCHPSGSIRVAVKMPAAWRGLAGRDSKRAHDIAEFCERCWSTGQFPAALVDPLTDFPTGSVVAAPAGSAASAAAAFQPTAKAPPVAPSCGPDSAASVATAASMPRIVRKRVRR